VQGIKSIECSFTDYKKLIYTIDEIGYLGVYADFKTNWTPIIILVIVIFGIACLKNTID
jgi:hypothetical protein